MRPFERRFVCDRCEGIFIELDDFTDAIGAMEPIDVRDEGPASRACPLCWRAMRTCQLAIGKLELDEVVFYCDDHGVWFGDGSLAAVLAQFERHHHRGGGGSPAASISSIYTLLRTRRVAPRPPPVAISAYRHRDLACPVCEGDLSLNIDRWTCGHCAGTFVENFHVEAMVSDMKGRPWQLATATGERGALACPVCTDPMHVEMLERVSIDRCGEHGIWFDPLALGTALHHASAVHERPSGGVAAWLRRFF
ncbi:MAG: zf-TFIIB domain-containing protein [Deltaproteobacteria bacterium]|nr:zf-TFIIB domain-containing protein [Deltaproteobacteria bacterium]